MEGITILSTLDNTKYLGGFSPWCILVILIAFAILILGIFYDPADGALTTIGIIICMIVIAALCMNYNPVHYNTYEVLIDESVSLQEFDEKYEIVDHRGEIYEIKEKEIAN